MQTSCSRMPALSQARLVCYVLMCAQLSAFKSQSEKALGEMQERLDKMKPKKSPMDLYKV